MRIDRILSIGDVAQRLQVNTHVIRNWCEKFTHLKINKTSAGHRYFNEQDLVEFQKVKVLIDTYGMSINGVVRLVKNNKIRISNLVKDLGENNFNIIDNDENNSYNNAHSNIHVNDSNDNYNSQKIETQKTEDIQNIKQDFINELNNLLILL